ncbi:MAG TPA: hypothetical protein VJL58_06560 [Pyrinomonadaceae bacterium]|nr:hypothetical protein [Pyrinomonadaceae bacterium]
MDKTDRLRNARNILLKLHKTLLDHERRIYEGMNGPVNSGEFLNLLLEDPDFAWLRKFSTLIVEIDEMFDQKDGFGEEAVDLHIAKMKSLIHMEGEDEMFRAKYQAGLQQDLDAAVHQAELKKVFADA